jgi:uracil-DNA glycosylase
MELYKYGFESWWSLLNDSTCVSHLNSIIEKLKDEYAYHKVYPSKTNIFRAFRETPINNCKYILLGMDPYPNEYKGVPSACGLSFVTENGYVNPSLRILCKSLNIETSEFKDYMLSKGVLLLNSALTLRAKETGSHLKLWAPFTQNLIQTISTNKPEITWILLGKSAQNFKQYINTTNIVEAPHPVSYVYSGNTDYTELKEMFKKLNWL